MVSGLQTAASAMDAQNERLAVLANNLANATAAGYKADQPEFFRLLFDLYNIGLNSPALRARCALMWSHFIDEIEAEVRGINARIKSACQLSEADVNELRGSLEALAHPAADLGVLHAMFFREVGIDDHLSDVMNEAGHE